MNKSPSTAALAAAKALYPTGDETSQDSAEADWDRIARVIDESIFSSPPPVLKLYTWWPIDEDGSHATVAAEDIHEARKRLAQSFETMENPPSTSDQSAMLTAPLSPPDIELNDGLPCETIFAHFGRPEWIIVEQPLTAVVWG